MTFSLAVAEASCGFQASGMEISFALDQDADARKSFAANFPKAHFEFADIREVCADGIRHRVEKESPSLVLFSGCAPCQPFTKQNTRRPEFNQDERVPLLAHFGDLVKSCRPDLLFVENVPGLQKLDNATQPFGDFLASPGQCGIQSGLSSR